MHRAIEQLQSQDDVNDQAEGEVLLADILPDQARIHEAEEAVARARQLMPNNTRGIPSFVLTIADAKVHSAIAHASEAVKSLQDVVMKAGNHGLLSLQFRARLASGETKLKSGQSVAGNTELKALEHDARAKGFPLTAHNAAAARKHNTVPPIKEPR